MARKPTERQVSEESEKLLADLRAEFDKPIDFRLLQFIPRSEESLFVITSPRFLAEVQRKLIDGWTQRMFEHFPKKPKVVFMEGGFRVEAVRDVEVIDYGTKRLLEDT